MLSNPIAPLVDGAVAALDAGKTKYTDRPGIVGLRQWVADDLNRRYDLGLGANQVTITCGLEEARFVAVTYLAYGGQVELSVPLDEVDNDVLVYKTSWDTDQSSVADGQNIVLDVSGGLPEAHPSQQPALAPRTITIGQFPNIGEGWRVAWMAGHDQHAKIRSYKQSMTICTPSVSQWAVLGMLEANG
ncbi:MAG: hypothetical protein AAF125_09770 [Chloroflexota bacterium]